MKKTLITLLLCLVTVAMCCFPSLAAQNITENANIKIVIDGVRQNYSDVPLIVDGRTMLPLRALLVGIGVPNDDAHIIWNASDKSVTFKKDTKEVKLTVNKDTAYVNGAPMILDAAPVIYKGKTYIPAKFVALSLDMKVVWDGSTSTVFIRDSAEYAKVYDILKKNMAAGQAIKTMKYTSTNNVQHTDGVMSKSEKQTLIAELDRTNKIIHITEGSYSENYITNDTMYVKIPSSTQWVKVPMESQSVNNIFDSSTAVETEPHPVMCAGMTVETDASGDIVLKGEVGYSSFLSSTMKIGGENYQITQVHIEMTLDKNSFHTKKAFMSYTANATVNNKPLTFKVESSVNYYDINSDFTITLPEEAKAAKFVN